MGDSKVNVGVKISPELKSSLEKQAVAEDRSASQLCEILLSWSLRQLHIAGDTIRLKKMSINSSDIDIAEEIERERELLPVERKKRKPS